MVGGAVSGMISCVPIRDVQYARWQWPSAARSSAPRPVRMVASPPGASPVTSSSRSYRPLASCRAGRPADWSPVAAPSICWSRAEGRRCASWTTRRVMWQKLKISKQLRTVIRSTYKTPLPFARSLPWVFPRHKIAPCQVAQIEGRLQLAGRNIH